MQRTMQDKEQLISRISELRKSIKASSMELASLERQLNEAVSQEVRAAVQAKNDFLRAQGLLPPE